VARMQAGLQLKNALYSKDPALKLEHQQRWLSFPEELRGLVKSNVRKILLKNQLNIVTKMYF